VGEFGHDPILSAGADAERIAVEDGMGKEWVP